MPLCRQTKALAAAKMVKSMVARVGSKPAESKNKEVIAAARAMFTLQIVCVDLPKSGRMSRFISWPPNRSTRIVSLRSSALKPMKATARTINPSMD